MGKVIKKVIYFSDVCAAQYKNRKNFLNLTHHQNDFGCQAKWHFFATSHGKGHCDGVGGSLKRSTANANLQRPNKNQIITPYDLYEFAKNLEKIQVAFCSQSEYKQEERLLQARFRQAITIQGTHQLHAFIPISKKKLITKTFSNSYDCSGVVNLMQ